MKRCYQLSRRILGEHELFDFFIGQYQRATIVNGLNRFRG